MKCSLCETEKDHLTNVTSPMDGVYTDVCVECIIELDFAFEAQIIEIIQRRKNED